MELKQGRPESGAGREDKEMRVYDLLDRLGLEYMRVDHAPATTMEVCREIDRVLEATICKNLFLCNRQQTEFFLLMMPGDKPFKTRELGAQIGSSRLSFAGAEHMERLLDISPGSVSVMGLMNDCEGRVRLLVDEDVLRGEYLGCHPCVNTSSLRLRTRDVLELFLPAVGHGYEPVRLSGEERE
ncbi:MAG: prolyl-tRNA synthetase associated domain-containing protein [Clostridia bacterium]|nr:prolyl-tRNA synthetase associated domain-containing protein [Clostridia bacterium]